MAAIDTKTTWRIAVDDKGCGIADAQITFLHLDQRHLWQNEVEVRLPRVSDMLFADFSITVGGKALRRSGYKPDTGILLLDLQEIQMMAEGALPRLELRFKQSPVARSLRPYRLFRFEYYAPLLRSGAEFEVVLPPIRGWLRRLIVRALGKLQRKGGPYDILPLPLGSRSTDPDVDFSRGIVRYRNRRPNPVLSFLYRPIWRFDWLLWLSGVVIGVLGGVVANLVYGAVFGGDGGAGK